MVTEAASLLGRAGVSPRGQVAVSRLVRAVAYPQVLGVVSPRVLAGVSPRGQVAVSRLVLAVAYPQVLGVVSPRVLAGASRLDQAVAARLVHVVDCPPDHARGLTRGEMDCCRLS